MSERVRVEEIAGAMGNAPWELAMHWIGQVGGKIQPNWAGRPSVTAETAAKVVTAYETAKASHSAKEEAYVRYLASRATERQTAGAEAFAEAAKKAQRRSPHGGPWVHSEATKAQIAALQEWDRKHPEKAFSEFKA
jgi:hypothetical protein